MYASTCKFQVLLASGSHFREWWLAYGVLIRAKSYAVRKVQEKTSPTKLLATELNSESDGKFGELKEVRETEFARDIDAAMKKVISKRGNEVGGKKQLTRRCCGYGG